MSYKTNEELWEEHWNAIQHGGGIATYAGLGGALHTRSGLRHVARSGGSRAAGHSARPADHLAQALSGTARTSSDALAERLRRM